MVRKDLQGSLWLCGLQQVLNRVVSNVDIDVDVDVVSIPLIMCEPKKVAVG